jgi:hypothetical protein
MKAYKNKNQDQFGNLKMPPLDFLRYINSLEDVFVHVFPSLSVEPRVSYSIKEEMQKAPFYHPCDSFPLDYLLNLFIRLIIFYALKHINRNFRIPKSKANDRKMLTVLHF